jgi:hypothetical protein
MKTLTIMFAAVVISTGAFAKSNPVVKSGTTQSNTTIINTHSFVGNGISYSDKGNHRKVRRSLKLLLKNPFRIVTLGRGYRY